MRQITAERGEVSGLAARLRDVIKAIPEEKQLNLLRYLGEKERRFGRKRLTMAAECESDRFLGRTYIHDISLGGVFLRASNPFDVGQRMTLSFLFPNGERLQIDGTVVREADRGVGVAFTDVTRKQERILRSFVEGPEA
jgi:Tfp pilus assembly protein PilZ